MTDSATLTMDGRDYPLPVIVGSEGERALGAGLAVDIGVGIDPEGGAGSAVVDGEAGTAVQGDNWGGGIGNRDNRYGARGAGRVTCAEIGSVSGGVGV